MQFVRIFKPDKETLKLFIPCRKNFLYSSKSAIKQLRRIVKSSITFYKVYQNEKFAGCLFIWLVDNDKKFVEFGGFSDRHVNTSQAIKEFSAFIKHYYPDYKIKATTDFLTAKISLTRAGMKNIKGEYIYG